MFLDNQAMLTQSSICFNQEIIRFQVGMLWDTNTFNRLQDIAISPRVQKHSCN